MKMSTPTYIPLLNSIVLGERGGQELYNVWAAHTADEEFADCLRFVAIREGEHAMAFTKRLCELGFAVNESGKGVFKNFAELVECVSSSASDAEKAYLIFKGLDRNLAKVSPSASDAEKVDNLFCNLFAPSAEGALDAFAKFFADNTIDPQTGELLGRYIAEERDSGRRLATTLRKNVNRKNHSEVAGLKAEIDALRAEVASLRNQGNHSRRAAA
jgi:hypothetical protein